MKYSKNKDYKVIAVVLACFSTEDQRVLINKISKKCEEKRCRAIFFSSISDFYFGDQESIAEESIFDLVNVEAFDAIVLMAETFKTETAVKRFARHAVELGVPVIAVDHHIDGCINISFDYAEAFRKVVKHMVEFHGYSTINFFNGAPDNSFSDERLNVFKEVLEENEIPYDPRRVYYGYFWEDPTVVAVEKMLQDWPGLPDAIICANDTMALTVCDCLQKKGYRIPQDVAVSGFDGIEAEKYHYPRLLTSLYDADIFLNAVFDIIFEEGLKAEAREVRVSAYEKLQIGGSCGCKGMKEQNAAAEIIRLKSNMYEMADYETNLGHMVAKYGNREEREIFEEAIPHQMRNMNYHEFWCCMAIEAQHANLIHYDNTGDKVNIDYLTGVSMEYLLPELDTQLELGRPLMVVPVPSKENPLGYSVVSFDSERFWYTAYSSFISHLRFLFDMIHAQKELMRLYRMDSLTGLLNRNGFYAVMEKVLRSPSIEELTIISLDMFQFKQINDNYGHAEGDFALEKVGQIIKECIEEGDIATRNGGDEFLIVLYEKEQVKRAAEIVNDLQEKARYFNESGMKEYKLIFSVGVYTETTENHSLDYFLREADRRMYEHKNRQRLQKKEGES